MSYVCILYFMYCFFFEFFVIEECIDYFWGGIVFVVFVCFCQIGFEGVCQSFDIVFLVVNCEQLCVVDDGIVGISVGDDF